MKVEFADDDLARIRTDQAFRLGLPVAVIQTARKRIYQLEAAKDERDLRNLKSLNYKKRKGDRGELHSVRVNDQYRIVFRLLESESPPILQIVEIGDTH